MPRNKLLDALSADNPVGPTHMYSPERAGPAPSGAVLLRRSDMDERRMARLFGLALGGIYVAGLLLSAIAS